MKENGKVESLSAIPSLEDRPTHYFYGLNFTQKQKNPENELQKYKDIK